jgi:hypothetical protein
VYFADHQGVLMLTSCDPARRVTEIEYPGWLRIRLCEHGLAELSEKFDAISDAMLHGKAATRDLAEAGIDVIDSAVEVTFWEGTQSAAIIEASGVPPAFTDAFGADGVIFELMSRADIPEARPLR